MLQTMGLQRVRRDLATEQQQKRQRCPCPNSRICEYVTLHGKRNLMDVTELRIVKWVIILDCLGESSVTTRVLISWGRSKEEGDVRMESERRDVATSQGKRAASTN